MKFKLLIGIALLLISYTASAQFNPKSADVMTIKITQSGSILTSGYVDYVNLTINVPQDNIESTSIWPDNWKYIYDQYGNKLVVFEWKKPTGIVNYKIETIVNNKARHLYAEKPIGYNSTYITETPEIVINDRIRELAYPYERSLSGVASITKWVHDYMTYDLKYVGKYIPSDRVLEEKRGVCVEHANLLTALLRSKNIPTRYVVGYAYSDVEKKFIGHTWVEVLAGEWVGFDPTWLEGGYIDATHIKTANLPDANQSDILFYRGTGKVEWSKNEDTFEMLSYSSKNVTSILPLSEEFTINSSGYAKASIISDQCMINDITANSCIDDTGKKMLNIANPNMKYWSCGTTELYWIFRVNDLQKGFSYTCPTSVYDQIGTHSKVNIKINGEKATHPVYIEGPDNAQVNESFLIKASANGILFSPDLLQKSTREMNVSFFVPAVYHFYFYSAGSVVEKSVNVTGKREFSISLEAPQNAKKGGQYVINISVRNLENSAKRPLVVVQSGIQQQEYYTDIPPFGERHTSISFNATEKGKIKITASAMGSSISSYTAFISVEEEKGWIDGFFEAVGKFFSSIINGLSNLFSR